MSDSSAGVGVPNMVPARGVGYLRQMLIAKVKHRTRQTMKRHQTTTMSLAISLTRNSQGLLVDPSVEVEIIHTQISKSFA
jgi:hypothetical protein